MKKIMDMSLARLAEFLEEGNKSMTSEIEKKFFEIFGIKKKKITPEIVLGLIKIVIKQYRDFCIRDYLGAEYKAMCDNNWEDWEKEGKDCKTEEDAILSLCITIKDEIQDHVKALIKC